MANYFFLKGREGGYYDEQKEILLDFIDSQGYTNICFLQDTMDKMTESHDIAKALIRRWGQTNYKHFLGARNIQIEGKFFSYGTVRTLGFGLGDFDVVIHIYAYINTFLSAMKYTYTTDHIFVYWVHDQPELDKWMGILNASNIRPEEHIEPVTWDHLSPEDIAELNRIRIVNISDGGTHPSDERLIKEVVQRINRRNIILDDPTFKAYLIRELHFRPHHAENAAKKVLRYLQ